jgi:tetratricopeptide (TPR) repeat protein
MEYVVFFMIIFIVIIFLKAKNQVDQINRLNRILFEEKQPGRYVREFDKLLEKKKAGRNPAVNILQKTTGLFYDGRFDEAVETLEDIAESVPGNWEPIYLQNLILSLLFKGETEKALEKLEETKQVMEKYKDNSYYTEMVEIVYAVSDYFRGERKKEYFAELSQSGANDYRKSFGYYFLGKINKQEDNMSEAEADFAKAAECGRGSFIEKLAREE